MDKPLAIMCDLDGTLCINDQDRDPFNYYDARHDAVNPSVMETLVSFTEGNPAIQLLFITAREKYGEDTVTDWLNQHCMGLTFKPYGLIMRDDGDKRAEGIVKEELYRTFIEPYWDILFVMDDRTAVARMWREIGLTCFQVA